MEKQGVSFRNLELARWARLWRVLVTASIINKSERSERTGEAELDFDPSRPVISSVSTLIIGCGNLLRGDDAVGPVLIRRMWDRGLPADVHCADGGTGGMDVAFQMRGVPHVILVDACTSGSEPGSIFELPGEEVEQLPPLTGIHLHAFRWDHALAFGRWLLKDDYPKKITVYLIEGASFRVGEPISSAVDLAINRLIDRLFTFLNRDGAGISGKERFAHGIGSEG